MARETHDRRAAIISDTFETAITWDRFEAFHDEVKAATEDGDPPGDRPAGAGHLPLHPCLSRRSRAVFLASTRLAVTARCWNSGRRSRRAASDAVIESGGTITHHHAVGRDHRPWYDRQRPELFAAALRAAKHALDPQGMLNPGVLIDP